MDHHPRRLRDYGQRVVFVDNVEWNILRQKPGGHAARAGDLDPIPCLDPAARTRRRPVDANASGIDELLDGGARQRAFDLG
jgi:hypothetical protein